MELESIKSEKFAAFKGDEIKNPVAVVGGADIKTHQDITQNGITVTHADIWRPLGATQEEKHWGYMGDLILTSNVHFTGGNSGGRNYGGVAGNYNFQSLSGPEMSIRNSSPTIVVTSMSPDIEIF